MPEWNPPVFREGVRCGCPNREDSQRGTDLVNCERWICACGGSVNPRVGLCPACREMYVPVVPKTLRAGHHA